MSTTAELVASGLTRDQVRAQLDARRWHRRGRAVVLHNGPPSTAQLDRIAMINAGPRSLLTSFTALERLGLVGWHRDPRHLLVPAGTSVRQLPGLAVRVHRVVDWSATPVAAGRPDLHDAVAAAVIAAASMNRPRPACALLAATVQQRLCTAADLTAAIEAVSNLRHRRLLLAATRDIGMGADALSEIDFGLLCRAAGLVEPRRQAVRLEPDGRRRYLDAEWDRADGRRVVAEIDGALHLQPARWWDDQLRQNEIVLGDALVLRFPSVVVREGDPRVVDQLRRAGIAHRHRVRP